MSDPFLAEIRIVSFSFAPKGWARCDGQILPIAQNQALFSLLGTMYGGNGQTNFALPNFKGRAPVHVGGGHTQGEPGGETAHTLTAAEMPYHTHGVPASTAVPPDANTAPYNSVLATAPLNLYAGFNPASVVAMNPAVIGTAGSGQAHQNVQPSLVLLFCIALQGIYPSRN